MKIVVAGGNGFLGRALIQTLRDHDVVVLARDGKAVPGARPITWNGLSMGKWAEEIDGADVVINYSGAPVAQKWTEESRKTILESRVQATYLIGQAIEGSANPPKLWINGSAVGIYGDRGAEILDECSPVGTGFLADVCKAWEAAQQQETLPKTRRVALRTGFVLGRGGGALSPLLKLTKLFMGGRVGEGNQWVPWIHLDDHTAMVRWIIENEEVEGPINACGIAPCSNATLMETLRKVVGRPPALPTPEGLIRLVGKVVGPDAEVVLASTRVMPRYAQAEGFRWKHPALEETLTDLIRRKN